MLRNQAIENSVKIKHIERSVSTLSPRRAAEEVLLLCTTSCLSPGKKRRVAAMLEGRIDWDYLLKLSEDHGITPLVFHALRSAGLSNRVPGPILARMNQLYKQTLFRNVILSTELNDVLTLFYRNGIAAIALKGTMLAEEIYGNPGLRPIADMDIMVPPEDLPRATSILLDMGYEQSIPADSWKHPFHEAPFYRQSQFPLVIELHHNLDDEKLMSASPPVIWQRAAWFHTQDNSAMMLSPEDTLLFLSNHLWKHHDHVLKSLNDIAELSKKYNGDLDWDYILSSAREWGIGAVIYHALKTARDLLDAPVPKSVLAELKPGFWQRHAVKFIASRDFFVRSTEGRLGEETITVVRGLMMPHFKQTILVITESCHGKKVPWGRVLGWTVLVFGAAVGRSIVGFFRSWGWR